METLQEDIDALAKQAGGRVFWDRPLLKARFG